MTYVLSRQVKPVGVLAFSLAYYFGLYRAGALGYLNTSLQSNLNRAAESLAKKYNIRKAEDYLQ